MKASDYIVKFLIQKNIADVFGYPGGMVTHFMDSLDKYKESINTYINYHEQASAMAACGWAEITGLPGVAFATSGPGATNLLTGIACAYYDSLPCIFITGQVNTYEQKGEMPVRQRGFQETDIVSMAKPVTKEAFAVTSDIQLPQALEMAYQIAMSGRRGPVLLDIPMNIFRGDVKYDTPYNDEHSPKDSLNSFKVADLIIKELNQAKRPVVLAGHGISLAGVKDDFLGFVEQANIPTVTSMLAVDLIPDSSRCKFGMVGAYGNRWANFILNHSDCILSLGSRLDCRQIGVNKALFAPFAKLLRVEIDTGELANCVKEDETDFCISLNDLLPVLKRKSSESALNHDEWISRCSRLKEVLLHVDEKEPGNSFVEHIGEYIPQDAVITTDVGQNQVWVAQSLKIKKNQRVIFSGGMGAMGYSLPAAIGAAIASKKPTICFCGDGGLQMNLQELQVVVRENLPIKIILLNNRALGMIHHFQEMYFNSNYVQTVEERGYSIPDFSKIMAAYGIRIVQYNSTELLAEALSDMEPAFIEINLPEDTHIYPKLGLNKPIHMQEPMLPAELLEKLESIALSE